MAQIEILGLYEGTPQIAAAQAGDGYKAPVTLQAATGNEVALELAYSVNKSSSGNDTGLLISMSDVSSPGTSLPLDIQVGGASKFSVSNAGVVTCANVMDANSGYQIALDGNTKIFLSGNVITQRYPQGFIFEQKEDIAAGHAITLNSSTGVELTDTDAEQAYVYIEPKINQSGTAGYTGIKLDVTETATGSGTNNLLDLQVGSATKFNVNNSGDVEIVGAVVSMANLPTADPTVAGQIWNNSGVLTVSAG